MFLNRGKYFSRIIGYYILHKNLIEMYNRENNGKIDIAQLFKLIESLKSEIEKLSSPPDQNILDDVDLQKLLKVSKRTTASYRQQSLIAYSQYGKGKVFYKLSDVLAFINKYRIDPFDLNLNIKL